MSEKVYEKKNLVSDEILKVTHRFGVLFYLFKFLK